VEVSEISHWAFRLPGRQSSSGQISTRIWSNLDIVSVKFRRSRQPPASKAVPPDNAVPLISAFWSMEPACGPLAERNFNQALALAGIV
jgi:hypothetical protein